MFNLSSNAAIVRVVLLAGILLALLLLPALLHNPTYAQDASIIEYAENDTVPVATFTAVDPEGKSIVWSLAPDDDMAVFSIEDGVLSFNSAPDFEAPRR